MPDETDLQGHCTCGAVRYRLTSDPLIVHACHCTECQRLTGGAFAVNALIESDRLELLGGEPAAVPVTGTSGKAQTIYRCPGCAVALWSHYPGGGTAVSFVRVGTLEDPTRLPPDIHIYTSTRLPWVELPEGTPTVAEFYAPKDVWRDESRERYRRLTEG